MIFMSTVGGVTGNDHEIARNRLTSKSLSSSPARLYKNLLSGAGNRDAINLVLGPFRADNGRSAMTTAAASLCAVYSSNEDHLLHFYERLRDFLPCNGVMRD